MHIYLISLCLSIEAESKEKAIQLFYERANECAFDRDSLEIEVE